MQFNLICSIHKEGKEYSFPSKDQNIAGVRWMLLYSLSKRLQKLLREIYQNSFVSYLLIEAPWFMSTWARFTPIQWLISGSPATELLLLRNSTQLYLKYILWKGAAFLWEMNVLPDWQAWKQAEQYALLLSVFHNIADHATRLMCLKMWNACSVVVSMLRQLKVYCTN